MHRTVKVQTVKGPLTVAFTGKSGQYDHCHVSTASGDDVLEHRGQQYHVSVHLYLKPQGWQETDDPQDAGAYITRQSGVWKQIRRYDTPTIYDALVECAAAAAERVQRENPHILTLAEADRLRRACESAQSEMEKAEAAYKEARAKRDAALRAEGILMESDEYRQALDMEAASR